MSVVRKRPGRRVSLAAQTAFEPPLVAIGVKADSGAYGILKETGHFALNMLGKGQQNTAFAFFSQMREQVMGE